MTDTGEKKDLSVLGFSVCLKIALSHYFKVTSLKCSQVGFFFVVC